MTELQALLMGLLQGLTEYLPVSSSGHLTIASALFGIEGEENLTFTIAVHVATVLSTLVILWREIAWLLRGLVDTKAPLLSPERKYILAIVISMIPIGIVGVFFKDYVEAIFGSGLLIVGFSLIITAALLTMSYYARPRQKEEISLWQAFVIGLAQSIAVLPGLSRSGSTIATGLLLGVKKEKMAHIANPLSKEDVETAREESFGGWGGTGSGQQSRFGGFKANNYGRSGAVRTEKPASGFRREPQKPELSPVRRLEPVAVRRTQPVPKRVADADFEPTPVLQLRVGQRIEHNRFGFGMIKEISGTPADLKAKIAFDEYGEKILILKYAKIRVVEVDK